MVSKKSQNQLLIKLRKILRSPVPFLTGSHSETESHERVQQNLRFPSLAAPAQSIHTMQLLMREHPRGVCHLDAFKIIVHIYI